ncbi:unnamed protein product [Cyclocybe aegerita]|uniref:Uncharacterized protein n=1 Tax=Cyclocybe aegerita TaxID=1973307 RepID=A0A8S0WRG1_CYCAE|nr:unnamed protein product [Cyclocybe aegerita]
MYLPSLKNTPRIHIPPWCFSIILAVTYPNPVFVSYSYSYSNSNTNHPLHLPSPAPTTVDLQPIEFGSSEERQGGNPEDTRIATSSRSDDRPVGCEEASERLGLRHGGCIRELETTAINYGDHYGGICRQQASLSHLCISTPSSIVYPIQHGNVQSRYQDSRLIKVPSRVAPQAARKDRHLAPYWIRFYSRSPPDLITPNTSCSIGHFDDSEASESIDGTGGCWPEIGVEDGGPTRRWAENVRIKDAYNVLDHESGGVECLDV